ncbi:MAG TPA: hypothetical protein VKQ09_06120 [Sphingomonas sp.]|nr:hypothetical protein [Sphingomonas sp.]
MVFFQTGFVTRTGFGDGQHLTPSEFDLPLWIGVAAPIDSGPPLAFSRPRYAFLSLANFLGICCGICRGAHMNIERHVKLFKNGRSQAVRIPREFELPGEDAIMRKEGSRIIIEPAPLPSLLVVET